MSTHSPAEWASFLSLGVGVHAAFSVPYFLLVDASRADFPRLWQAAVNARHDLNWAISSGRHLADEFALDARLTLRDAATQARRVPIRAAISAATLLALLTAPEAHR